MHSSGSRLRTVLSALVAALTAPACATAPPPTSSSPATTARTPARSVYEDVALGYRFALPDTGFHPSDDEGWAVASGDLGVRVFPVFTVETADGAACLKRILESDLLPDDLAHPVSSASELERAGAEGLAHGDRRLFLRVFPREKSCLVAVVDGHEEARTATAAAVVLGTFVVGEPDVHVRPLLEVQAGWELLRGRRGADALARFKAASKRAPALARARLGAGLAAATMGREGAGKAVEHLTTALATGGDWMQDPEAHRDALMYLGLAYAGLGRVSEALQPLAEAAVRYPGDPTVAYNLGCIEALAGDGDEAMFQLKAAFASDPALVAHARDDEDLVSLRSRPDFRALVPPDQDTP